MDFNLQKPDFSNLVKPLNSVSSSVHSVIDATAREKKEMVEERERTKTYQAERLQKDSEIINLLKNYKPHPWRTFFITIGATVIGTAIITYGIPSVIALIKLLSKKG